MKSYVNPNHPEIRKIAEILKDKEPMVSELEWVHNNISYGMGRCIDLELETCEPTSLRADYEVLKTSQGICADMSFLLASLLRNRFPAEKVKLAAVSSEGGYNEYKKRKGSFEELSDPFDHMCVAVIDGSKKIVLDPTSGEVDPKMGYCAIAEDYAIFNRAAEQGNCGIISALKTGWVNLEKGRDDGKYIDSSGHLDGMNFYRAYSGVFGDVSYMEKWDLSVPKISESFFVDKKTLQRIDEKTLQDYQKEFLAESAEGSEFPQKLKKRLGKAVNPKGSSMYG